MARAEAAWGCGALLLQRVPVPGHPFPAGGILWFCGSPVGLHPWARGQRELGQRVRCQITGLCLRPARLSPGAPAPLSSACSALLRLWAVPRSSLQPVELAWM